ncbi:MAG: glycoside hydrolase family 97 protein [Prevotellaceae bacterium]|nr:glycoside hydrolase family 97 protein [Prevotellaceae bacterium]
MKKHTLLVVLALLLSVGMAYGQKAFKLKSPDGQLETQIVVGQQLTFSVAHRGDILVTPSPIALRLTDGEVWGESARLQRSNTQSVKRNIRARFYRSNEVADVYNELTLTFRGDWGVEFRAYNDGVAYRFVSRRRIPFTIQSEEVCFGFADDVAVTAAPVNRWPDDAAKMAAEQGDDKVMEAQFGNSFENTYQVKTLSQYDKNRLLILPLVVNVPGGRRICITESDLEDYPGLYLHSTGDKLSGVQAPYPKTIVQGGHNNLQSLVTAREEYIAKVHSPRTFPWRAMIVTTNDRNLAASNMTYCLAAPSRIEDASWIKPGKVAWEWWNDWNLEGVDFVTGVNNRTYKFYIDFASRNGIEYVILDEGWAVNGQADLMKVVPDIDIAELVKYGAERGVGIILWAGYYAFNRDMDNLCRHYAQLGVKGFKVDFMDRDDQQMVAFNYRAAATTAKHKLLLDLHGMYKPAGLNRTYPNVLNFEGVHGLEQMKWAPATVDQVTYDVMIPFIRQAAGPMDYTQGAMRNAVSGSYYPCNSEPMSQGTRCRQLAMYVVYDSPLNMLCDSPTNYMREPQSLEFISTTPTVWDETRILDGSMGEYIVTARRSGTTWYVGGMTNNEARSITLDLSFIDEDASYLSTLFKDGVNAHRKGSDYRRGISTLNSKQKLTLHMAPGGGFAMKLEKNNR